MRSTWLVATIALATATCGAAPAWALAGGGFAPGGPMSGSMRPSCDGYNMDGTLNTSAGAHEPGCVDHSERAVNRFAAPRPYDR